MQTRLPSAALVFALALAPVHAAFAQSIDHGAFEQLFNEPATTSATGSPLRVTEAPADMSIITQDEIRRSGATDLPTILSRVPGIDILNWSTGHADVAVRGYDQIYSPRLLVMIDGREVYLNDFGYTAWASLPVTLPEIRQIEVVRGPNSALFGFNAVGGVINIITFNPKYDDVSGAEAHGGTQADAGGSVMQTLRLGSRVSVRLSAGGERQDEWRNGGGFPTSWNFHSRADAVVQLAPAAELRLEASLARSQSNDMALGDGYLPGAYTIKSLMGTLIADTAYGQLQARAYVNNMFEWTIAPGYGQFDIKNQSEVASLQDLLKVGPRNTVRLALEYRDNQENTMPVHGAHVGYSVIAPSIMWGLAAGSRLSLTVAGRLDHLQLRRTGPLPAGFIFNRDSQWDRATDAFSANLGAVHKLTDLDTVRATYARGIQTPTLVEFGALQVEVAPGLILGGNPQLRPTVVSNYELSYDRAIPEAAAKVAAKVFFQQTRDVKGNWDFDVPTFVPGVGVGIIRQNVSDSDMVGFELAASGAIRGGFHWSADTTYTAVADTPFPGADLVDVQAAFAHTTPAFRGNLAAGWSGERWAVDLYGHYVTAYDAYSQLSQLGQLERTPAYASVAARVGYRLSKGLTVAVSGQNLGADRQVQGLASGLRAERRALISLSQGW